MGGQGSDRGAADGAQEAVFNFLADPATHGIDTPVKRIDTHGAAVFLAGGDVYKVKRAVRYSFMDFSTLEKRRRVCAAEVAINRANAPGLYRGVVPIRRSDGGLVLGREGEADGAGDVVEWAVHMRRFDEEATLDRLAARDALPQGLAAELADMVVRAHAAAPAVADPAASVDQLARYARRNAEAVAGRPDLFARERVVALRDASLAAHARLRDLLLQRARDGFVRRCHGDMHLRNIVLIDGAPVLFDAIEFDDSIATTDLLYDLAFLLMDLWGQDRPTGELRLMANAVLNRYLWARAADAALAEADIAGLAALPLFLSLRAGVRAMVTVAALAHLDGQGVAAARQEARHYVGLSEEFLSPPPARLIGVGGLSGTGKSTLSHRLAPAVPGGVGAVHLRSDIVRKHLFGVAETTRLPPPAYTPEVTAQVYERLRRLAAVALAGGQSVIVDAVHARPDEREALEAVARRAGADFAGLWLEAPLAVLEARVTARTGDASDADADVVRGQSRYTCGDIGWRRLETGGAAGEVAARARRLLGLAAAD